MRPRLRPVSSIFLGNSRVTSFALRLKPFVSAIRFRPFETRTAEGRSRERHRRVALTTLASGVAKITAIATALISIPLTLGYLGPERFGLWMTISSVIAILAFADFGVGNGVLNAISEANGRDDHEAIRKYVTSGFFILTIISVGILAVFSAAYSFIPWPELFNVKSHLAVREAGPAITVFTVCFALNIPLGIVQRVQLGLQQGFLSSLWQCLGSVLGLLGILVVVYIKAGLPWLVLAMAGAPLLASVLNGVAYFGYMRPALRPRVEFLSGAAIKKIMHIGFLFLVLQIAIAVAFSSDNIIIARIFGPEAVTQYSVPAKMFSMIGILISLGLTPLWPAYGEAIARGDRSWVEKTLTRSMAVSLCFSTFAAALLVGFGGQVLKIWVGAQIDPSFLLLMGLGIWVILEAGGNAWGVFLNGANVVRMQVIIASLFAISSILFKIFLAKEIGIPGIVWATVITYAITAVIPYMILAPRILAKLKSQDVGRDQVMSPYPRNYTVD